MRAHCTLSESSGQEVEVEVEVEQGTGNREQGSWLSPSQSSQRERDAAKPVETVDNSTATLPELIALAHRPTPATKRQRRSPRDSRMSQCPECGSWRYLTRCTTCEITNTRKAQE